MRVIICGTRRFWSTSVVRDAIRESGFEVTHIIAGGARGIDRAAEDIAVIDDIPHTIFPADWQKYGNQAGPIRNRQMADCEADACIALPDSESIGTRDMINVMLDKGKPVYVKEVGCEEL